MNRMSKPKRAAIDLESLREDAVVQRRTAAATGPMSVDAVATSVAGYQATPVQLSALDQALIQFQAAVMSRQDPDNVHQRAAAGMQGGASRLPHLDTIQRSFGHHDVSGIRAYTGGHAQAAAASLGAHAYASGDAVVLGAGGQDLHTVAHEAAHVVQQRGGVALKGGVGQAGDRYEQHADAVADLVVQGKSAEGLLDRYAGAGGANGPVPVAQRHAIQFDGNRTDDEEEDDDERTEHIESPYHEDETGRRGVRVGHSDDEELVIGAPGQVYHRRDERTMVRRGATSDSSRRTRTTLASDGRYAQTDNTEEEQRTRLHRRGRSTHERRVESDDGSGESSSSSRTEESRFRGLVRTEETSASDTVTDADGASRTSSRTRETTRRAGNLIRQRSARATDARTGPDGAEETTTASRSERRGPGGIPLNRSHEASATRTEADGSTTSASSSRASGRRGRGVGGESSRSSSHRDANGAGRTDSSSTRWNAGVDGASATTQASRTYHNPDGSRTQATTRQTGSVNLTGPNGPAASQSGRSVASSDGEMGHAEASFEHSVGANYSTRIEPVREDGEITGYLVIVRLNLQGRAGLALGVRPRTEEERTASGVDEESDDSRQERQLTGELRPDQQGANGTLGVEARGHVRRTWETRHLLSPAEVQPYLDDLRHAEEGHRLNNELPEHVALRTGSLAHIGRLGHMGADDARNLRQHEGNMREAEQGGTLGGHVGAGRGNNSLQLGIRVTGSGMFRMRTRGLGDNRLSITLTERRQSGVSVQAQGSARGRSLGGSYTDRDDNTFAMTFELDQSADNFEQLYNTLDNADSTADIRRFAQAHPDLVRGRSVEDSNTQGGSAQAVELGASYQRRSSTTEAFQIEEEEDDDNEGDILITVTSRRGSSSGETVGATLRGVRVQSNHDESESTARSVTFRLSRNASNFEQLRNEIHQLQTQRALREYQHAHSRMVENVQLERRDRTESGGSVQTPVAGLNAQGSNVATMGDQTTIGTRVGENGEREQVLTGRVRAQNRRSGALRQGDTTLHGMSDSGSVDLQVDENGEVDGRIERAQGETSIIQAIGRFAWDSWNSPGTVFRELWNGTRDNGLSATIRTAIRGRLREVVHAMGLRINTNDFHVIASRAGNRGRWTECGIATGGVTGGFLDDWEACRVGLLNPPVNPYEAQIDRDTALLLAKFRVIGRCQRRHARAATAFTQVAYRWGERDGLQTERAGTREEWPDALSAERERYAQMIRSANEIANLYNQGSTSDTTNRRYRNCQQQLDRLLRLFRQHEGEFDNANAFLQMTQALRQAKNTLSEARDRAQSPNSQGSDSSSEGQQAEGQQEAGAERTRDGGERQDAAGDSEASQRRLRQAGTRIWPVKQQESRLLRQIGEERHGMFTSPNRIIALLGQLVELYEESFVPAVLHMREVYQDANVSQSDWKVAPTYHGHPRRWDPNLYRARTIADETTRAYRRDPDYDPTVSRIEACMRQLR